MTKFFQNKVFLFTAAIILVGGFFVANTAKAATINVGTDQTYPTIQAAIDAASSTGDTINVYPGTYNQDEANSYDAVTGDTGTSNFNIFVNKSVIIQGVDDSGTPILSNANVAAKISPERNTGGTIFVQADDVAISGLEISGWTGENFEKQKTVEVTGNNFTLKNSYIHGENGVTAIYFDDSHYDSVNDISSLQAYHVENNRLDAGGSLASGIRISSGAGWSGDVANRIISGNTISSGSYGIQFVGPGGDPWDVYPVGAATITTNNFSGQGRGAVVAWGKYKDDQGYRDINWDNIYNNNTFDKAVIVKTSADAVRFYDSSNFYFVRGIYSAIQTYPLDLVAQNNDTINVAKGKYAENLTVGESLSLIGVGDTTIINGNINATGDNVTIQSLKITNPGAAKDKWYYGVKATANHTLTLNNVAIDGYSNNNFYGIQMGDDGSSTTAIINIHNSRIRGYGAIYLNGANSSNVIVKTGTQINVTNSTLTGITNYSDYFDDFAVIEIDNTTGVIINFTDTKSVVANEYTNGAQAKKRLIKFINASGTSVTGTPTYTNGAGSTVNAGALFVSPIGYTNTVEGQVVARYVSNTAEFAAALASASTTPIVVGRTTYTGEPVPILISNSTLKTGVTLIIEDYNVVKVVVDNTLTNNGTIIIEAGATFTNNGTISGTGTISNAKTAAHSALTTALGTYTQSNYTAENWTALTGFKLAGDTAIDSATDTAGVTSAQNTATVGMAGVAQIIHQNNGGGNGGGGGGSVISAVPANVTTPDGCAPGVKFSTTTGRNCNAATPALPSSVKPQVLGVKISAGVTLTQLEQILADAGVVWSENIDTILANASTTRSASAEKNTSDKYLKSLTHNEKNFLSADANRLNFFITYGTVGTKILGAGERAGVINSYKAAFGKLPKTEAEWQDAIKIANGRWPSARSEAALTKAKITFKAIYGREADMNNAKDNAAVTVMAYGLRPSLRNLNSEKAAILAFRYFIKHAPVSAIDWDTVRAIAYSGAKR